MSAGAAEALRQALDAIAVDTAHHEAEIRQLASARANVEAALRALDEDPAVPSLAELEEFRPSSPVLERSMDAAPSAPVVGEVPADSAPADTSPTFPCPDCGDVFATLHGMRGHRGRQHRAGLVLACSTCPSQFRTSDLQGLIDHCASVHGRVPTLVERTPGPSAMSGAA